MHDLPSVHQDLYRILIAHRSLGNNSHPDWGDRERLSVIGRRVMPLVITDVLSRKQPPLDASQLEEQIQSAHSPDVINEWATRFHLREIMLCAPDLRKKLYEEEETDEIVCSWLGAVYLQHGLRAVLEWIGPLIDPSFGHSTGSKSPPQPSSEPPPAPPHSMPQTSLAAVLPSFNQQAAQRHLSVEYKTTMSGVSHAPQWHAECLVNGVCKGLGTGTTKQLAKEEAAKQALFAMGWKA